MMPISFDIKYKPDNTYVIIMKWLGKPESDIEISGEDLDILLSRARELKDKIS